MPRYELTSTCDDAGNMLAARLDEPNFVRIVSEHSTRGAAEEELEDLRRWYAVRGVPIGSGCLAVREKSE